MQSDSFQLVFGMIMTLLIALEFKHSIVKVAMLKILSDTQGHLVTGSAAGAALLS